MAVAETSDVAPMLWLVDLLARQPMPAVVATEGMRQPALSDDGMTLMFLSGANWAAKNDSLAVQVWTMDLATGRLRQWSSEAAGPMLVSVKEAGREYAEESGWVAVY
jgi:Tol biopolymer transport system component